MRRICSPALLQGQPLHRREGITFVQTQNTLQEVVQREIHDPMTGRVGMHVLDLNSGQEVLSYDSDEQFLLASLTKIITNGAAFEHLGADTRFSTSFASTSPVSENGLLDGDLFIRGGGDPTIGDDAHVDETYRGHGTTVSGIANALRSAGIKRVTGQFVADGSLFTAEGRPRTDWVSALTFNRTKYSRPLISSTRALAGALETNGVTIDGGVREGVLPTGDATEIAYMESPTVTDLAVLSGYESDNFVAEILTKQIGARISAAGEGSTAGGCALIEEHASRMGAEVELWNGSGLVRRLGQKLTGNRGTPRGVVAYLQSLTQQTFGSGVIKTLPRAGTDGTAKERMRNSSAAGNVRAKTGTLFVNYQSRKPLQDSLAGYCHGPEASLAFAVIYERAETQFAARSSLDRVAAALADYCSGWLR